jgi:protein tyrosine/serine phosphatase
MEFIFETPAQLQLAIEIGQIETPEFVTIRNYTNASNEIAHHNINLGVSYRGLQQRELDRLLELDINTLSYDNDVNDEIKQQAYTELIESLTRNMDDNVEVHTNQSKGQLEAFTKIAPNLNWHQESNMIMVNGMAIKKTIVQDGEYDNTPRRSRAKTRAKATINRDNKMNKYRRFKLNNINCFRVKGKELNIELDN